MTADILVEWRHRIDAGVCPLGCGIELEERADDPGILTCVNCGAMEDYCPACGQGLLEGIGEGEDVMRCSDCGWPKLAVDSHDS